MICPACDAFALQTTTFADVAKVETAYLCMTGQHRFFVRVLDVPRCQWCEGEIKRYRKGKRFCSDNCRKTSSRKQPRKELIS